MGNYLTSNKWLMDAFTQMLKVGRGGAAIGGGDALTQKEFENRYQTGYVDPAGGGRTRYYYDYDFGDIDVGSYHQGGEKGETEGRVGSEWQATDGGGGYKFHDEDTAYQRYLDTFKGDYGQLEANIFDPESWVSGVEEAQGVGSASKHDPSMFTAFTPEMFKKLRTEHYQPELEQKRGSLLDTLIGKQKRAKDVGGGFAGYGGREAAGRSVEEDYRGGVKDIYTDIGQQKAQGLQSIYDVLGQYEDLT